MDTKQLEHIRELFEKALEQAADQRMSWLQNATDNPTIKNEVLSLLAAHESAGDFLEEPLTVEAGLIDELEDPMIGKNIGNYAIESLAGMGGTGAVYAGHRSDNLYEKKVAIKILKYGITSEYLLKRFRIERQTLANLQHYNITRLIDGGRTESGLPYLIMEFVDGTPITEYCRTNNLSIHEKVELFRQVCDAVQYAHQSLIVHRDIKPGNILVTNKGIPKLMDFGIAKIIDEELSDTTANLTMTGMWHLTPEYASPEQVKGETITTATDIYSLGVLLYEVLTDCHPIQIDSYSPSAISKAITEYSVKKPSEQLFASEQSSKNYKNLKGDLDNIVLKAMHKDPDQRYASVQEFNDDLLRYLDGLPVIARKDSFAYTAGKFIQRHKLGVGFFIVIQLLVLASIVLFNYQRNIAEKERDRAQIEATKFATINDFLLEMLSSADPAINSRDIKVYDLLENAAEDADARLINQPEIQAAIKQTLGSTFSGLGEYEKAEILLIEANEINKKQFGENSVETAHTTHQLAVCFDYQGEFEVADSLYLIGIELYENTNKKSPKALADVLNDYATMLTNLGYLDSSASILLRALDIYKLNGETESKKVASTINNLAVALHHQNKVDEAENYYLQAIDMTTNIQGAENALVAQMQNNLAFIYLDNDELEKSEQAFINANKVKKQVYGPDHPSLGLGYTNLGMLYFVMEDYDKAVETLNHAVSLFQRTESLQDPRLALAYYWLGNVFIKTNELQQAENVLLKSLKIREAIYPEGNYVIWSVRGELGVCYVKQKRFKKAEEYLLNSLKFFEQDENYNKVKVERYTAYADTLRQSLSK